MALALVLTASAVAGVLALATRPDGVQARVAELEAVEVERDARIADELVATTRQAYEAVLPVVEALDQALPADGSVAAPAQAQDIARWSTEVAEAEQLYANPESAGTSVNVARAGLQQAITQLGRAVDAYRQALTLPQEQQAPWLQLAGQLRTDAVVAWSIAATQLDSLAVETDQGHVHLYLPAAPGSGAMSAEGHDDTYSDEGTVP